MAKATKTIQHALVYKPTQSEWFHETHVLYNRVVAFYFDVVNAHEGLLDLSNKEALTALEKLTHATLDNPAPAFPLVEIADSIPAMFRRAAINAALGSARSFLLTSESGKPGKRKQRQKAKSSETGHLFPLVHGINACLSMLACTKSERKRAFCSKCGQVHVGHGSRYEH